MISQNKPPKTPLQSVKPQQRTFGDEATITAAVVAVRGIIETAGNNSKAAVLLSVNPAHIHRLMNSNYLAPILHQALLRDGYVTPVERMELAPVCHVHGVVHHRQCPLKKPLPRAPRISIQAHNPKLAAKVILKSMTPKDVLVLIDCLTQKR